MVKSNLLRVKPSELGDGWDVGCERGVKDGSTDGRAKNVSVM